MIFSILLGPLETSSLKELDSRRKIRLAYSYQVKKREKMGKKRKIQRKERRREGEEERDGEREE